MVAVEMVVARTAAARVEAETAAAQLVAAERAGAGMALNSELMEAADRESAGGLLELLEEVLMAVAAIKKTVDPVALTVVKTAVERAAVDRAVREGMQEIYVGLSEDLRVAVTLEAKMERVDVEVVARVQGWTGAVIQEEAPMVVGAGGVMVLEAKRELGRGESVEVAARVMAGEVAALKARDN